ncbi:MAG: flavoprotein, partial [Candidatus Puniceispirillum sp.]
MATPAGRTTSGPRILLIVSGGIAAYKALETARRLIDRGAHVTGVMTQSAKEFISPLSLAALTGEKCYDSLFSLTDEAEMGHINLARGADLVLVVPATANFIARAAAGLADDLATTVLLATTATVAMAPAMNPAMWAHPATQENLTRLKQRGVHIIGPASGDTACGEEGEGRMNEPLDIA